jgi:hypothetical protein
VKATRFHQVSVNGNGTPLDAKLEVRRISYLSTRQGDDIMRIRITDGAGRRVEPARSDTQTLSRLTLY